MRDAPCKLHCPKCGVPTRSIVTSAAGSDNGEFIRRARTCRECGGTQTSYEIVERPMDRRVQDARHVGATSLTPRELIEVRRLVIASGYTSSTVMASMCSLLLGKEISQPMMDRILSYICLQLKGERLDAGINDATFRMRRSSTVAWPASGV